VARVKAGVMEGPITQYLLAQMDRWTGYHNHKEQMAYAIFGFEAAFFAGIFVLRNWPPGVTALPAALLSVVILLMWLLFHTLLRFQLRMRRLAAINVAAVTEALEQQKAEAVDPQALQLPDAEGWKVLIDTFIWPVRRSVVLGDLQFECEAETNRIQPHTISALRVFEARHKIKAMNSSANYAQSAEWIVTLGSILLLVLAQCRVWFA